MELSAFWLPFPTVLRVFDSTLLRDAVPWIDSENFRIYGWWMELGDSDKVRDERSRQFQAEYDALVAVDAAWREYFTSQSESDAKAKLESPGLAPAKGRDMLPRWQP